MAFTVVNGIILLRIINIGTFGKELTPAIVGDKNAPAVVLKCIEAVEARGLQNEGIYRVSPSHLQRKQLKEALDKGTVVVLLQHCNHTIITNIEGLALDINDPQWTDVNLFAGCLKMYFQELPEPLFTYQMYTQFIDVISESFLVNTLLLHFYVAENSCNKNT